LFKESVILSTTTQKISINQPLVSKYQFPTQQSPLHNTNYGFGADTKTKPHLGLSRGRFETCASLWKMASCLQCNTNGCSCVSFCAFTTSALYLKTTLQVNMLCTAHQHRFPSERGQGAAQTLFGARKAPGRRKTGQTQLQPIHEVFSRAEHSQKLTL